MERSDVLDLLELHVHQVHNQEGSSEPRTASVKKNKSKYAETLRWSRVQRSSIFEKTDGRDSGNQLGCRVQDIRTQLTI